MTVIDGDEGTKVLLANFNGGDEADFFTGSLGRVVNKSARRARDRSMESVVESVVVLAATLFGAAN
jgi:hypothetical protein